MRGGGRGEWEEEEEGKEEEGEEEKQTMAPAQGLLCGLIARQSVGQSILIVRRFSIHKFLHGSRSKHSMAPRSQALAETPHLVSGPGGHLNAILPRCTGPGSELGARELGGARTHSLW